MSKRKRAPVVERKVDYEDNNIINDNVDCKYKCETANTVSKLESLLNGIYLQGRGVQTIISQTNGHFVVVSTKNDA